MTIASKQFWNKYKTGRTAEKKPATFTIQKLSNKACTYMVKSNAYLNIAVGNIRSGKTIVSLLRFFKFIIHSPHTDFSMAGKTMGALKRNVVRPFLRILDSYHVDYSYSKYENEIRLNSYNKLITLYGIDKAGSDEKIKGSTYGGSFLDEVTVMDKEGVLMLISRNSLPNAQIFTTCNPSNPNNFFYTDYITNDELKESGRCFVLNFFLEDNLTLSQDYIDNLKAMYPPSSVFYKRNILNEWVGGEGMIFDGFTEENIFHGAIPYDEYYKIGVGSDYGVSTTSCYSPIGIMEKQGKKYYYCFDESYYNAQEKGRTQTDTERAGDIIALQNKHDLNENNIFYPSHDAGSLKAELQRTKAMKMKIKTFKPDTLECIQVLSNLFYENRLFIHESCTETIKQIQSYKWDLKATERGEDAPLKVDDHLVDSLRAPIMEEEKSHGVAVGFINL